MSPEYPEARRDDDASTFYGERVEDPYRWMEDDSEERREWIDSQKDLTNAYLDKTGLVDDMQDYVRECWDYQRVSNPVLVGEHAYYFRNQGLDEQSSVWRVRKDDDLIEDANEFIDPADYGGEDATVANLALSGSGRYAAFTVSSDGSDWQTLHVVNTESGDTVINPVEDLKFSQLSWVGDKRVLFSTYDRAEDHFDRMEAHRLCSYDVATGETTTVFGDEKQYRFVHGSVSEDDEYIVVTAAQTTDGDEVFAKRADDDTFKQLVSDDDHEFNFLTSHDDGFLFETTHDAPNSRVVRIPFDEDEDWSTVIAEKDHPIDVSTASECLFVRHSRDARHSVTQHTLYGERVRDVSLPGDGHIHGFTGRQSIDTTYFTYMDHLTPPTVYEYGVDGDEPPVKVFEPDVGLDDASYTSYQVMYESEDGTSVPLTITHKEDLVRDGSHPALLYGYGGFGITLTPTYNASKAAWIELGGVYAEANIRGGGEYGESWHEAGKKQNKQAVFDDFAAAAEHLVDADYTDHDRLAVTGASNGGLLVGALLTQRPSLIEVALPRCGVYDMLRYADATVGAAWTADYGTPEDGQAMFEYLRSYSPLHNVDAEEYPATLLYTAENDDRVVPWHTYKFTAALQGGSVGDSLILLDTHEQSGHGGYRSTSKQISAVARRLAFTVNEIGVGLFDATFI